MYLSSSELPQELMPTKNSPATMDSTDNIANLLLILISKQCQNRLYALQNKAKKIRLANLDRTYGTQVVLKVHLNHLVDLRPMPTCLICAII